METITKGCGKWLQNWQLRKQRRKINPKYEGTSVQCGYITPSGRLVLCPECNKSHSLKMRGENKMETKHGITIREKNTNLLVEFVECSVGRSALRVLSGVRHNLGEDYKASEEFVAEKEIKECK